MAAASYYHAESDFCFSVSNLMLEKYIGQIETKFSAFYYQMRVATHSKKQFRTEDIAECLNEEFEKFAKSRLKWISKPTIGSGHITSNFLLGLFYLQ